MRMADLHMAYTQPPISDAVFDMSQYEELSYDYMVSEYGWDPDMDMDTEIYRFVADGYEVQCQAEPWNGWYRCEIYDADDFGMWGAGEGTDMQSAISAALQECDIDTY